MAKKTVSLDAMQATIVRNILFEGPIWGDEKAQWRQRRLQDAVGLEPGPVELVTTSRDRAMMVQALQSPQAMGALKGRALGIVWETKEAFG